MYYLLLIILFCLQKKLLCTLLILIMTDRNFLQIIFLELRIHVSRNLYLFACINFLCYRME